MPLTANFTDIDFSQASTREGFISEIRNAQPSELEKVYFSTNNNIIALQLLFNKIEETVVSDTYTEEDKKNLMQVLKENIMSPVFNTSREEGDYGMHAFLGRICESNASNKLKEMAFSIVIDALKSLKIEKQIEQLLLPNHNSITLLQNILKKIVHEMRKGDEAARVRASEEFWREILIPILRSSQNIKSFRQHLSKVIDDYTFAYLIDASTAFLEFASQKETTAGAATCFFDECLKSVYKPNDFFLLSVLFLNMGIRLNNKKNDSPSIRRTLETAKNMLCDKMTQTFSLRDHNRETWHPNNLIRESELAFMQHVYPYLEPQKKNEVLKYFNGVNFHSVAKLFDKPEFCEIIATALCQVNPTAVSYSKNFTAFRKESKDKKDGFYRKLIEAEIKNPSEGSVCQILNGDKNPRFRYSDARRFIIETQNAKQPDDSHSDEKQDASVPSAPPFEYNTTEETIENAKQELIQAEAVAVPFVQATLVESFANTNSSLNDSIPNQNIPLPSAERKPQPTSYMNNVINFFRGVPAVPTHPPVLNQTPVSSTAPLESAAPAAPEAEAKTACPG